MFRSIKKFDRILLLITFAVLIISYGLSHTVPEKFISISWPFITAFFFAITRLVHQFLLKKSGGQQSKFINAFLLTTTVKLLLFLTMIVVYVLIFRADAIGFILTFFINYLIYTVFEIVSILKYLKLSDKSN